MHVQHFFSGTERIDAVRVHNIAALDRGHPGPEPIRHSFPSPVMRLSPLVVAEGAETTL
jgi:hypothetical protein